MADRKVRVGLIGVGNCASSLVQGLTYYRDASGNEPVPGLMHVELGGYHIGDIEISAAFDVADAKVGRDVAEAIYAGIVEFYSKSGGGESKPSVVASAKGAAK